ncbi:hypothetical protein EI28_07910 [Methanoculleus sp. MH98A]|nr:hypothetical protein EI28_07910 [Methanoculleus sp. MH98A]
MFCIPLKDAKYPEIFPSVFEKICPGSRQDLLLAGRDAEVTHPTQHPAAHDRLAYPLYGLTEEEIAIVEGAA